MNNAKLNGAKKLAGLRIRLYYKTTICLTVPKFKLSFLLCYDVIIQSLTTYLFSNLLTTMEKNISNKKKTNICVQYCQQFI